MNALSSRLDLIEKAVLTLARAEFVGDLPGHPFRGNQYTGGIGEALGTADKTIKDGKAQYMQAHGLATMPTPFHDIYRAEHVWKKVGQAMAEAPMKDTSPRVVKAYEAMRTENKAQWELLTKPKSEGGLGIRVDASATDPYPEPGRVGFDKMMKDLSEGHMGVLETHGHPFFSDEEYTQFRAVHDAFGHASIGRGFDRHSEEAAWVSHAQMYSDEARPALTTETRGQNAYLGLTHEFSVYKMALLPDDMTNPLGSQLRGAEREAAGFAALTTWDDPEAHQCSVSGHVNVPTNHPAGR